MWYPVVGQDGVCLSCARSRSRCIAQFPLASSDVMTCDADILVRVTNDETVDAKGFFVQT